MISIEVAGEVDVADQPSGEVRVRVYVHAAAGSSGRGRRGPSEHGEVHDRQDRGVPDEVDELVRVEEPVSGDVPTVRVLGNRRVHPG